MFQKFIKDFKFTNAHGRTEDNETSTNDAVSIRSTRLQSINFFKLS